MVRNVHGNFSLSLFIPCRIRRALCCGTCLKTLQTLLGFQAQNGVVSRLQDNFSIMEQRGPANHEGSHLVKQG